jgi:molybdate transport system ATP-binding protein
MMSTAPVPLVSFTGLTVKGESSAFDWALYPGEQWAITGPTASGKSLLARAVAGQGSLAAAGVWSPELGSQRIGVRAYVAYIAFDKRPRGEALFHQARWHTQLAEDMPTVDASLAIDSIRRRNPYEVREDRQPDELVAFQAHRARVIADLDLAPLLKRRLHHLSDGEWRRVRMGQALLGAPRLLILDDPFTGQDREFRIRLRKVLACLMQQGTQLLLVIPNLADLPAGITHLLALGGESQAVCGDRITVLRELEAARLWPPAELPDEVLPLAEDPGVRPGQPETPPAIRMQDVTIVHGDVAVLRDVSWTVRRDERWALVGPNGAGKSTLLSLILGDHPQAYANRIELFGRRRGSGESIWEIKRRIGWVAPELHRYFPLEMTTAQVVASGFFDTLGTNRAWSAEQQAEVGKWMAHFDLGDRAARAFRTLSKGEQRLALIARALVKSPELLVLDEPCQGLDAAHVDRVLQALENLTPQRCAPGRAPSVSSQTMIYVTHRPEEFPHNLTHVLELDRGQMIRQEALPSPGSR